MLDAVLAALGFVGDIDDVDGLAVLLELERRRAAGELVRSYVRGHGLLYLPPGFKADPEEDGDDMVAAAGRAVDAAERMVALRAADDA